MKIQKGHAYKKGMLGNWLWFVSEKLDGFRARWTGTKMVLPNKGHILPWPHPMPDFAMDGELWAGHGRFQDVAQIRSHSPDFSFIRFMAFDAPGYGGSFRDRYEFMKMEFERREYKGCNLVTHIPFQNRSHEELMAFLKEVCGRGAEGLMLHRADSLYVPGRRTKEVLKVKPVLDEEVTVIGHTPGTGKHEGRLGALWVRDSKGREFKVGTGFRDQDRERPPPIGSLVTISFSGRSRSGKPRHAAYVRIRV